jgi:hypothetical protein
VTPSDNIGNIGIPVVKRGSQRFAMVKVQLCSQVREKYETDQELAELYVTGLMFGSIQNWGIHGYIYIRINIYIYTLQWKCFFFYGEMMVTIKARGNPMVTLVVLGCP